MTKAGETYEQNVHFALPYSSSPSGEEVWEVRVLFLLITSSLPANVIANSNGRQALRPFSGRRRG
jgi:hypothetical protein